MADLTARQVVVKDFLIHSITAMIAGMERAGRGTFTQRAIDDAKQMIEPYRELGHAIADAVLGPQ